MGTKRSLGASPASASTSNATRSSSSKVSGTPSITLTTQSRHPGPRTAQSSQSMTTGSVDSGGTTAVRSGSLLSAIRLPLSMLSIGVVRDANVGYRQVLSARLAAVPPFGATRRGSIRVMSVRLVNVAAMGAPAAEQLSLPDLDGATEISLRETTFVVVDLETTGGRMTAADGITADAITEIGAVK